MFNPMKGGGGLNNVIRTILIGLVSTVWAANFTAPIFVPNYQPPEGVHVAFMAIVGVLTAGYDRPHHKKNGGSS